MLEVLNKINEPKDLNSLSKEELEKLSKIKYTWRTFWTKLWNGRSNNCNALCV